MMRICIISGYQCRKGPYTRLNHNLLIREVWRRPAHDITVRVLGSLNIKSDIQTASRIKLKVYERVFGIVAGQLDFFFKNIYVLEYLR